MGKQTNTIAMHAAKNDTQVYYFICFINHTRSKSVTYPLKTESRKLGMLGSCSDFFITCMEDLGGEGGKNIFKDCLLQSIRILKVGEEAQVLPISNDKNDIVLLHIVRQNLS